ncbi:MAG: hypothetical protein ACTSRE_04780 [Promethearchaeota archaeon]
MKRKRTFLSSVIVVILLILSSATNTQAQSETTDSCSIFTISIGDTTYFGNNEDFLLNGTYLWLVPRQDYNISNEILSLPGVMLLGFDHNDHMIDGKFQGGMNEYGLCWDSNGLPPVSMYWNTSGKEIWYFTADIWIWMQPLLECRDVSDVITWFSTYDLGDLFGGQSHFCDADGNSVVVSVNSTGNFTYTIMGEENLLVSTNFNIAWPDNHYDPYPCSRYETVTTMLEDITTEEKLTPEACRDILETVAVSQTSYSNVFDPVNQEMYLNINQDFENTMKLNLHDELAKVTPDGDDTLLHESYYYQQILLADLYKKIPGYLPIFIVSSMLISIISLAMYILKKKSSK